MSSSLKRTLKVAAYIAISAVTGYLITEIDGNPELFGPVTVVVNLGLVYIREHVKEKE